MEQKFIVIRRNARMFYTVHRYQPWLATAVQAPSRHDLILGWCQNNVDTYEPETFLA